MPEPPDAVSVIGVPAGPVVAVLLIVRVPCATTVNVKPTAADVAEA